MAALLSPGTLLHGRYTIERVVKVGLQGAMYTGTDAQAAAKSVAIRESLDPSAEAQDGFQREAQVLAALEHPGLPVVIDYFVEPSGLQYLVTEHVEGASLADMLARGGPLPEADVLAWFDRLLAAVEYLHAQRPPIVHGGIAPSAIVITPDGTPHLTDLAGLGGTPDGQDDDTPASAALENPFLPPEQHLGHVDQRSDIYSIGATLYALLTGKAPTSAPARASGEPLAAPRELNPAVSRLVEAAILKATALEPQQRFGTPSELWHALHKHAGRRRRLPVRTMVVAAAAVVGLVLVLLACSRLVPLALRLAQPPAQPPTRAPTAKPSATRIPILVTAVPIAPSHTATPEPTAVPTEAPAAEPAPAVTRSPEPTVASQAPASLLPAPVPLSPREGEARSGEVEFIWYFNEPLAPDEYFDLQVWALGTKPAGIAWCKETFYRISQLPGGSGNYSWRVRVIRGKAGQVQSVISETSAERNLSWRPGAP